MIIKVKIMKLTKIQTRNKKRIKPIHQKLLNNQRIIKNKAKLNKKIKYSRKILKIIKKQKSILIK